MKVTVSACILHRPIDVSKSFSELFDLRTLLHYFQMYLSWVIPGLTFPARTSINSIKMIQSQKLLSSDPTMIHFPSVCCF